MQENKKDFSCDCNGAHTSTCRTRQWVANGKQRPKDDFIDAVIGALHFDGNYVDVDIERIIGAYFTYKDRVRV